MVKVLGYNLSYEDRNSIKYNPQSPARTFLHTSEKYVYNKRAGKVAMLLILSDSIKQTSFEINDKILFEESGRISYENVGTKIDDMKEFGTKILLEQAIIAIVSNWETYFSGIFNKIFDDDKFINRSLDKKEQFKKFISNTRLFPDFQQMVILNKNKYSNLLFGTYIVKNKKISFQDLNKIKTFLKLADIDIVNSENNSWTEIDKFFEARHILVHKPNDSIESNKKFKTELEDGKISVSDIYNKTEIEKIMKIMAKIIDKIDMELFDKYDTDYLDVSV
ncbi:MAG: hypothetical protein KAT05_11355 [Spirochaetes bacterium]|nr:hypothetical protein [Spirochaetota bacterium]